MELSRVLDNGAEAPKSKAARRACREEAENLIFIEVRSFFRFFIGCLSFNFFRGFYIPKIPIE